MYIAIFQPWHREHPPKVVTIKAKSINDAIEKALPSRFNCKDLLDVVGDNSDTEIILDNNVIKKYWNTYNRS